MTHFGNSPADSGSILTQVRFPQRTAPMPSTLLTEPSFRKDQELFHVDRILKPDEATPPRKHKVIAVLPAYNAEKTLARTIADFPAGSVDEILLVDDGSKDNTV